MLFLCEAFRNEVVLMISCLRQVATILLEVLETALGVSSIDKEINADLYKRYLTGMVVLSRPLGFTPVSV